MTHSKPRGRQAGVAIALLAAGAAALHGAASGRCGRAFDGGVITGGPLPEEHVAARRAAHGADPAKRSRGSILFGDLHVHTAFSGEGVLRDLSAGVAPRTASDACDRARHCAELDFFSLSDHAEDMTPAQWVETRERVDQCNGLAGAPTAPDLVAFAGWEWTPPGIGARHSLTLLFPDTDFRRLPARPIGGALPRPAPLARRLRLAFEPVLAGAFGAEAGLDLARYLAERAARVPCPPGAGARDLPASCSESAATASDLFAKLDAGSFPTVAIQRASHFEAIEWPGREAAGPVTDPPEPGARLLHGRVDLLALESGPGARASEERAQRALAGLFDAGGRLESAPFGFAGSKVTGVRAAGPDRASIFRALRRRESYASTDRSLLLWFDLVNGPETSRRAPMGSVVKISRPPRFEVRALAETATVAPPSGARALSSARRAALCADPPSASDRPVRGASDRPPRGIDRIEVVRILSPGRGRRGEAVAGRVEDPWLRLSCSKEPRPGEGGVRRRGCRVRFDDPSFPGVGRGAIYYVRAIEENGPEATERASGIAWSSPIFLPAGDAAKRVDRDRVYPGDPPRIGRDLPFERKTFPKASPEGLEALSTDEKY